MSKEKKLAKKEKKALKKHLKLEKKMEKLEKKRKKIEVKKSDKNKNQVEKIESNKLISDIKVDKIEQETESPKPLPPKILIHRSDAKDVKVENLSKVVLRNRHKPRGKINSLNSSNESFNHLKKASSDCDLNSVKGRKMRKQQTNEIKSLLYNPMRFSATASQLNLSSTQQSTESISKKDKCFFESNTIDQKSLRDMKKNSYFESGRPHSEGFVKKEDRHLIETNSELQISHKVEIKKEHTLDNLNYETKKKKKLKARKAARSSSIVRLSQKRRNKKRFKVINRLLRRLETKKDEPMDCRDENEIEEKEASRSRAITALSIMIPEKNKIKGTSSKNNEAPLCTVSDEQEVIIQEVPRIKRGKSVLATKNENRLEKKRKRKIRFFKKRKKSIKLSNIQKKEAFPTDQEPPSTLRMENLKCEVDEVTEIVRNSALDLLNQREATLNQALESCERLNETADQFAKITTTIYLKEKHRSRCCGLLPNWRWCWFLCSCKCSPTKCKKKDKKKKAFTSEELPEEKQSLRPCSSEISSSKSNENKKISNMDDELSIYKDEETRERARQLLLLDSE